MHIIFVIILIHDSTLSINLFDFIYLFYLFLKAIITSSTFIIAIIIFIIVNIIIVII